MNLYAGVGVAVRELVTQAGPADYVLFVNRQAVGVIEAKKRGTTLSGVEWQTVKYQASVPHESSRVRADAPDHCGASCADLVMPAAVVADAGRDPALGGGSDPVFAMGTQERVSM